MSSVDPQIPIYSTVTGERIFGQGIFEAAYWHQNLKSPVLFNSALRAALSGTTGRTIVIEVGAHPALGGPIGQIIRDIGLTDSFRHFGTLERNQECQQSLLNLAGKLFQQHAHLDYSALFTKGIFVRDIPRYAWKNDTSHWLEPRVTREWRFRKFPPHELLGVGLFDAAFGDYYWRKMLSLEEVPWLAVHVVNGETVFPAAGYIAMVGEAIRQLETESTYSLRNVRIMAARTLQMDESVEVVTNLRRVMIDVSEKSPWYSFNISSFDGTTWIQNVTGEARASMDKSASLNPDIPVELPQYRSVDPDSWYDVMSRVGLNYTGLFRGLQSISAATCANEASARISSVGLADDGEYSMHPTIIDQCFQSFSVAAARGLGRQLTELVVPTFIGEMVIVPTWLDLAVRAKINTILQGSWCGDMSVYTAERQVLHLKNFRTSALSQDAGEAYPILSQLQWMPHSDFVDLESIMRTTEPDVREWHLLEELTILCAVDNLERLVPTPKTPHHLRKYLSWMRVFIERYKSGENSFVSRDRHLENLTNPQRIS